jgi:hypothetical protein
MGGYLTCKATAFDGIRVEKQIKMSGWDRF